MDAPGGNPSDSSQESHLWGQLLANAAKKESVPHKHIMMLGDVSSGKSSLLAKLQGRSESETHKPIALEYTYIELFADEAEDDVIARIHVWQHEGESVEHKELLSMSVNASNFEHSAVIITVDFLHPWKLVNGIQQFLKIVEKHVESLKLNPALFEECQKKQIKHWNEYVDPLTTGSSTSRKILSNDDPTSYILPDGVLTTNLGLPIIVVVCKSDATDQLEKDFGYKDGHFDYIQQYLRRICIQYGASLIYTSTRQGTNCNLLMEYIQNQLYDIDFAHPAQVIEKDSIFVPRGWDSLAKIQADFDNQRLCTNPDEPYESVIQYPAVLKLHQKDTSAVAANAAEDDSHFLARLYQASVAEAKATPNDKKSAAFFDQLKKFGSAVGAASPSVSSTPATPLQADSKSSLSTPVSDKNVSRALQFATVSPPDEASSFFNSILGSEPSTVIPTPKKEDLKE